MQDASLPKMVTLLKRPRGALWAGTPPESLSPERMREAMQRHEIAHSRELAARSLALLCLRREDGTARENDDTVRA